MLAELPAVALPRSLSLGLSIGLSLGLGLSLTFWKKKLFVKETMSTPC